MSNEDATTQTEYLSLTEAARLSGLKYKTLWDAANGGRLRTDLVGSKRVTTAAALDRFLAATAAAETKAVVPEPIPPGSTEVPAAYRDLEDTCRRYHELGINQEALLRELEGDAREAETQGDIERADFVRWLRGNLPTSQYRWDSERRRWLIYVPAAGVIASADPEGRFTP